MRKKSSERFESDQVRQSPNASSRLRRHGRSPRLAKSTSPVCSPVAGLYTGHFRPDEPFALPADPVADQLQLGRDRCVHLRTSARVLLDQAYRC